MISVLVYGRNDAYGYNLHKRAAISINAICALLDDPDDELIFVDYNTPDDFPTFPEAIQDTLTARSRERLRVLRARPAVHRAIARPWSMPVIEPVCRNIGARRSNPANRWLLSTNTDIILKMRADETLHALLRRLEPGFYHAPRLEIPELVWEAFDRMDPAAILGAVGRVAPALHLDEIVRGSDAILYDGPGDFQLMERDALFAIDGFDEAMDRGWHVDANLAVRMALHHGAIHGLEREIFAYHCDHTRQVTRAHRSDRQENDCAVFVDAVRSASLPAQRETWGSPDAEIEEIRLDGNSARLFLDGVSRANGPAQDRPGQATYAASSYDRVQSDPRHVLPYLLDLVASSPRGTRIGWVGWRTDMLERFVAAWRDIGFDGPVLVDRAMPRHPGTLMCGAAEWCEEADVFVFDFGSPEPLTPRQRGLLGRRLHDLRTVEAARAEAGLPPRRIAGIDVVHNRYERAFSAAVDAAATPFSTRLRHGFAKPLIDAVDWLALMTEQHEENERVAATRGLAPGRHTLRIAASADAGPVGLTMKAADRMVLAWQGRLAAGETLRLPFEVAGEDNWVSLAISGAAESIAAASSTQGNDRAEDPDRALAMLGHGRNWLPSMLVGAGGRRAGAVVEAIPARRGDVVYGPYWSLPPGSYVATFEIVGEGTQWGRTLAARRLPLKLIVRTSSGDTLARRLAIVRSGTSRFDLPFTVSDANIGFPLEFVVNSSGTSRFSVMRVEVALQPPPDAGRSEVRLAHKTRDLAQ